MEEQEKIVVIEDNDSEIRFLLYALKNSGLANEFKTLIFKTLIDTLDYLAQQGSLKNEERDKIRAFIVDLQLSETMGSFQSEEGIQIIEEIRKDDFYKDSIIIGNSSTHSLKKADHNINKDYSPESLAELIKGV